LDTSKVSIVVLAAGTSERFGREDKLSQPLGRQTILEAVLQTAQALDPLEVIIVARQARPPGAGIRVVLNDRPGDGAARSVALGVRACSRGASGFLVWPGDMPLVRVSSARAVIERGTAWTIVRPKRAGAEAVPGHPVLFGSAFRLSLESLESGPGARSVVSGHREALSLVLVDDPGITQDVDTAEDYATLLGAGHA
jgi:molybdenum cofactor cytidylyltransferase